MNELSSINQFFSAIDCRFQCYDMGRLIHPLEQQTFIDFEQTRIAWKAPFMQHAWMALLFWEQASAIDMKHKDTKHSHTVWFLKLPLDEQARLNLAARDDFLHRLFATLTSYLDNSVQKTPQEKRLALENSMKDSPYGFQPKQEQMANFHALVHKHLGLPASQYYQNTQKYFSGTDGFEQWSELGLQGIADMAARLDEDYQDRNNQQLITEAIKYLPLPPFQALGNCLENHIVSQPLLLAILNRVTVEQENNVSPSAAIFIASIRAAAQASDPDLQAQLLSKILTSPVRTNIEILAAISSRCWQQLIHPEILSLFLEALAGSDQNPGAFNAIMSDLMFIPGMRASILQAFRSSERSELLVQAIGRFLNQSHLSQTF